MNMSCEILHTLVSSIFQRQGLTAEDAMIVADNLIDASLRGVDTHGVILIETYVKRLQAGTLNSRPTISCVDHGAMARLHGDNGMGQVVGYVAMQKAIEKSKQYGIGLVTVNHSNHFGTASYFSTLAVREGLIGITFSNASPRLAPWGGVTPVYGNNPWSIAAPWSGPFPIVLDIANSVVAFSKILTAQKKGETIPEGWALDVRGQSTTDPHLAEVLLPIGGHKGYGIAVMIEILTGVLSGSAIGQEVGRYNSLKEGQNVGHTFLAVNIDALMPRQEFNERLETFVAQLKSADLAEGVAGIQLPGEPEYRCRLNREKEGIPLSDDYMARLHEWAGGEEA
jgi:LDH2 family malate/lactate/ureidoglycolate dehydrogenase